MVALWKDRAGLELLMSSKGSLTMDPQAAGTVTQFRDEILRADFILQLNVLKHRRPGWGFSLAGKHGL